MDKVANKKADQKTEAEASADRLSANELHILILSLDSTIAGITNAMNQKAPEERKQLRDAVKMHQQIQDKLETFLNQGGK